MLPAYATTAALSSPFLRELDQILDASCYCSPLLVICSKRLACRGRRSCTGPKRVHIRV